MYRRLGVLSWNRPLGSLRATSRIPSFTRSRHLHVSLKVDVSIHLIPSLHSVYAMLPYLPGSPHYELTFVKDVIGKRGAGKEETGYIASQTR